MNLDKLEKRTYKLRKIYCRYYEECESCPFGGTMYQCKLEYEAKKVKGCTGDNK